MHSFHLFLMFSASIRYIPFLSFIVPIFGQNISLIFSIFQKRSLVFPFYYFPLCLCTVYGRRPSFLSLLFFGTLSLGGCTFLFISCFSLLFFPQLFVKPPQITTLPSFISFSLRCFDQWLLYHIMNLSIVLKVPWSPGIILLFITSMYNHKEFDLGCTWMAYWFSLVSSI